MASVMPRHRQYMSKVNSALRVLHDACTIMGTVSHLDESIVGSRYIALLQTDAGAALLQ